MVLINPVNAQILVGPAAGGQYSWTTFGEKDNKNLYHVEPVFGYHMGGHVSFRVRKRFFLHTSLLYSTKGKRVEGKVDLMLKNQVRYSFIDIPVLYTVDFKARVGRSKEFKYFAGIGPNISYWLGGKGTVSSSDLDEAMISEQPYRIVFRKKKEIGNDEMNVEDPNRIQLGLNLGAGVSFEPYGFRRVIFLVRYEMGHSYLSGTGNGKFVQTYYEDVLRMRNNGIRLSLIYQIDLRVEERKRGKSTLKI